MENMELYERFRQVPQEAQKSIAGGRLKGMTDINPMWRIKLLTERFGPCGMGWKYTIKEKQIIPGAGDEVAAFVDIDLYYKDGERWSDPVPGTGGSMLVSVEKSGARTNDECFKMALTDAISVAAKALGVGADVYWQKDRTKYSGAPAIDTLPNTWAVDAVHEDALILCGHQAGFDEKQTRDIVKHNFGKQIKELSYEEYTSAAAAFEARKK